MIEKDVKSRWGKFIIFRQMDRLKRYLRMLFLLCFLAAGLQAHPQAQIPNGDFETWDSGTLNLFEEPGGGWFVTLNLLRTLGGPVSVEKSTDAHSGMYAAKLTTGSWGTLLVPGLVVTGEFDTQNPTEIIEGKPYTGKPSRFGGWYKYSPANGDSGAIGMLLTRWNSATGQRDTVGEAGIVITTAIASWTEFDLPVIYHLPTATPDTLVVAITSSADGANFIGEVGSTLWVDDVELDMTTAQPEAADAAELALSYRPDGSVRLAVPALRGAALLQVHDIRGQLRYRAEMRGSEATLPADGFAPGIYLLSVQSASGQVYREKVRIFRP